MVEQQKQEPMQTGWVLGANDLLLGDFVYLNAEQGWTPFIKAAKTMADQTIADELLSYTTAQRADEVVGAELVPVRIHTDGVVELVRLRDRLREAGPTHRSNLSRIANARAQQI